MADVKFEVAPLGTTSSGTWHDLTPYIFFEGLKYSRNDIDASGSGRAQNGYLYRHRIAQKARWDATLRPLTQEEMNTVLGWVDAESFLVRTASPRTGETTIYKVYSNNIPATFKIMKGDTQYWAGIQIPFIEM